MDKDFDLNNAFDYIIDLFKDTCLLNNSQFMYLKLLINILKLINILN
jgi:hypothetical protein